MSFEAPYPQLNEFMSANLEKFNQYRVIVWAKQGIVTRSDASSKRASDRIEFAETAAN